MFLPSRARRDAPAPGTRDGAVPRARSPDRSCAAQHVLPQSARVAYAARPRYPHAAADVPPIDDVAQCGGRTSRRAEVMSMSSFRKDV